MRSWCSSTFDTRRFAMFRTALLMPPFAVGLTRAAPAPSWNINAKQFIFAPAFDFKPVAGATAYRFTIGERSFEAASPLAELSPIWADVPVGTAELKVEAINDKREVIAVAGE